LLPTPVPPVPILPSSSSVPGPSYVPNLVNLLSRFQTVHAPVSGMAIIFFSPVLSVTISFSYYSFSVSTAEDIAGIRRTQRVHDNASELALLAHNLAHNLRDQANYMVILFVLFEFLVFDFLDLFQEQLFMTQPFRPPTGIRSSVDAVGLSDDQVVSFRLQHAAIRTAFAGNVNLGGVAAPVWVDIPVCFFLLPFLHCVILSCFHFICLFFLG